MKQSELPSRREFIQTSGKGAAALVAGAIAAPSILRGAEPTGDPVRIGHIGVGTRGGSLVRRTGSGKDCQVVAICDVYKPHVDKGVELANNPEVKTYLGWGLDDHTATVRLSWTGNCKYSTSPDRTFTRPSHGWV